MTVIYFNAVINRARGQKRAIEGGGTIEATEIEATEIEVTETEVTEIEATETEAANLGMTEEVVIGGVLSSWSFSHAGE
jgi:hypothetical protein